MGQKAVFADAHLDVDPRARRLAMEPDAETPFRIALMGDFRGRRSQGLRYGERRLEGCRAWPVDKDDFHDFLDRVGPRIQTPAGPLELRDLDDFHPDALYADAPVFVELRRLRKLLRDPDGFRAAARELFGAEPSVHAKPAPASSVPAEGGDILDAMLSGGAGAELPQAPAPRPAQRQTSATDSEWKSLIRNIVAPHMVPRADPRQAEMLAQLDEAIAAQMRLTLHEPSFQSLEVAWRSVFLLLDRLETGADLKIDLIDLSKDELLADLSGEPDAIGETGLHRILVDEAAALPGSAGYAVVACLHTFGETTEELLALGQAARISALAGSPIVVAGAPQLLGVDALDRRDEPRSWPLKAADPDLEAAWRTLRALPDAEWVAVAAPRFLLRTPYGEDGSSTDLAGFEELPEDPPHNLFLWGPAPVACACLLGEAFMRSGWKMRPGSLGLLDRRPVWHAGKGSDREMVPGAEVWLTDAAVEQILERGLTPLVSIKGRDAIAVARLQSVASPARPLRGPWDEA